LNFILLNRIKNKNYTTDLITYQDFQSFKFYIYHQKDHVGDLNWLCWIPSFKTISSGCLQERTQRKQRKQQI